LSEGKGVREEERKGEKVSGTFYLRRRGKGKKRN
jgi:hypothetical protein